MEQVSYIHVDSRNRDTTLYPFSNTYTVFLNKPITNVTRVDLVSAIVTSPSTANAYIWLDIAELRTPSTYDARKLSLTNVGVASTRTFISTFGPVLTSTTLVAQANQTYTSVASTATGSGTGARFTVVRNGSGAVSSVTNTTPGSGYAVGDTITIAGTSVGGASPADNITFQFIAGIGSVLTSTTLAGQANQTYTSVSSFTNGVTTGALFTVVRNASGAVSTVTNITPGSGYAVGDTVTIPGTNVGGASPQDNITFQFTTGSITSTTIAGELNRVYTNVPTTSSGSGTGARFTVTRNASGAVTSVILTNPGAGYIRNDTITISYTNVGGTSASDNISFPVAFGSVLTSTTLASQASLTYTSVSSTGGSGSGARFTVVRNVSAAVASVTYTASTGSGYFVGDTITIPGTNVGGTGPADNITFQVTAITTAQYQIQSNQTSSLTPATSFAVIPMDVAQNFQRTFKETTDYAWSVTYPSRLDSIERLTVRWLNYQGTVVQFGPDNAATGTYDPNMFVLRVYTQIVPATPERPLSLPPPVREGLFEDKSRVYLGALGTLIVGLIMIMLIRKR
jgi:hypothetical protein